MNRTGLDLMDLVGLGASIIVDAQDFTMLNIWSAAAICQKKGGTLIVKNVRDKSMADLRTLAEYKNVIIDLT